MKNFSQLSRVEMKRILGGDDGGSCYVTTYGPGHSNPSEAGLVLTESGCPGAGASAQQYCSDLIATPGNGVYHCSYNCGC